MATPYIVMGRQEVSQDVLCPTRSTTASQENTYWPRMDINENGEDGKKNGNQDFGYLLNI